jgi:ABC-type transport system involved in cytochrome bd biosynthesis fused ATPase/permease subunit
MEPAEFFRLHGSLGPSLFRYYAPMTSAAVILAVTTAALARADNLPWLTSAGLCLTTLVIFLIYFRAANNRFATHDISNDNLASELQNWSNWHWLRTSLVIVALGTSIYGHTL